MKNKKGFTLVELLAVIVVLAIIMIIAVPAVLDSMESARTSSFRIYAENAIRKAMEKHQTDMLTNSAVNASTAACYTLTDLKMETGGDYKGFVRYVPATATAEAKYVVTLTDKNHSVTAKTLSEVSDKNTALAAASSSINNSCS